MNSYKIPVRWRSAVLLTAALTAGGCSKDVPLAPGDRGTETPLNRALNVALEASSLNAAPGSKIAVSVMTHADTKSPLITLQGYVHFNPAQLRYLGQDVAAGTMAVLNEKGADRGELRMLALKLPELEGQTATFIFEVKQAGYSNGLSFDLEQGSTADGDELTQASIRRGVTQASSTTVPEAKHMTMTDWTRHLEAAGYAAETSGSTGPALTPGAGTKYGDVNLTNTINGGDVTYLANVSVGNFTLADAAANRDAVLAGNVAPNNGSDGVLVGFGDACRPGVSCSGGTETGPGDINGADVGQIAQEVVGNDRPVVGELIPGRTAAAGRVIIPEGIYSQSDCQPSGTIPCHWTRDNVYQLNGVVQFDNGVDLIIDEGTRIEGNTAINPNALYIRRNATIHAVGSALAPIVFTCTGTKSKGCWGGVAIAGNAPVNLQQSGAPAAPNNTRNPGGGGNTRFLEGPVNMDYGGSNVNDNSGVMKYVRIEYAGFIVGTNNELNGLTLGGVGAGTTFDYIQIHAGLDDGIEHFGGTDVVKHLYLTANSDDSFDWSFGWQGKAQFVIIQQDTTDADKGLEGDNSEGTGATFDETPRTNGPLYNFTMVGAQDPLSTTGNVVGGVPNNVNDAVHIRRGNWSVLGNSIIASFPVVMDLDDAATCTNAATDPKVINTTLILNSALGNSDGSDPVCLTGSDEAAVLNNAANNNTVISLPTSITSQLVRPFDVFSPDFRPVAGSTTATGSTATVPAGLEQTSYRGAVPPAAAVTQNNISWYMGWTRGWQNSLTP